MDENEELDSVEPIDNDAGIEREVEDVEENAALKIKKIKQQLKECEKEKMEHLENLQRAKAEFLNAKRRLEEEKLRDRERAAISHIEKLLPMCDSFHMAMSDKKTWESIDHTWRKGIENINNQLQSILSSYNVFEIAPEGESFDPNKHEAMTTVHVDDEGMHGKVVSVIQNGFMRKIGDNEHLIRPARVTVGEHNK